MSFFSRWIYSFLSIRPQDVRAAKIIRYHPKELLKLSDPQKVIDTVINKIAEMGWNIREKPPINDPFFKRFSTTVLGTVWVSHGFWKGSKIHQASVLAHEYCHLLQWMKMDGNPNVFLKYYASPRGGWISEVQAARFQIAVYRRIDPTLTTDQLWGMCESKARGLWSGYPNIHLLRKSHVMRRTPALIFMGVNDALEYMPPARKVPRRPSGLSRR